MREPSLLVFDLDGTLLDGKRRIPARVRRLLFDLRARGIQTTLATGRSYIAVRRYIKELDLQMPLIIFNGAVVATPSGDPLWARHLPKRDAVLACRLLANRKLSIQFYLQPTDDCFHTDRASEAAARIAKKDGVCYRISTDLARLIERRTQDPVKLFSIGPRKDLEAVRDAFKMKAPGMTCVFSERDMLEFLGVGVTKGAALHVLCEHVGVLARDVMAFGDNLNDLEMIRDAGVGVAMAASPKELQHVADEVVGDLEAFLFERFKGALGMEEQDA
jgi:Cof subfamily protein (haloacid dehalogenase superfamily)